MSIHITPYLALVLAGYASFMVALAYASLRTALPSRKPSKDPMAQQ